MTALPRIAITLGDPSGVGPEISRKAAAASEVLAVCEGFDQAYRAVKAWQDTQSAAE